MDSLTFNEEPTPEEMERFYGGLRGFNRLFMDFDFSPFAVTVTSPDGKIVGGIAGESYWGRMHISNFWIAEGLRRQGLGRRIMAMAEKAARERDCAGIDLDTMSWQAAGFYEKLGFTKVGEIGNYKGGHARYFYSKELHEEGQK